MTSAVPGPLLGALVRPGPLAELLAASPVSGLDVVVLDTGDGPPAGAELVSSPEAAAAALGRGATFVLYDLAAMVGGLLGSLAVARPVPLHEVGPEPMVMLPGMLGDPTVWDGVAARLADVVAPVPLRIDLDDSVSELAASVLAQAPGRFALVGHSLGAIVALEVVRQAPERVTRLVLVNASGRGPSSAQQQVWSDWATRTRAGEFAAVAAELARTTLPTTRRDDADLVTAGERMAARTGGSGFLRQLAAQATRPDNLDLVARLAMPVLVVSGALDEVCPPALQEELVDRGPGATLVTIGTAGHMLPIEDPDALADAIRAWLPAPRDVADGPGAPVPA